MSGSLKRTGTTWTLSAGNVVVNGESVTDETDDAALTYTMTHKGTAYQSGSLTWEPGTLEDTWGVVFLLPPTPGILAIEVTVTVGTAIGRDAMSIEVVR